ncbi:MAG: hypothetical protein MZV49_09355 [Rhodopseudomonas palustris]|nr:hypothetical protein [Rhodopseudomonas palustris]
MVVTGRSCKAPNLVSLDFDNREGARLATEHLIGLGPPPDRLHRRRSGASRCRSSASAATRPR